MVLMSSSALHLCDKRAISPEQLARFMRDQQRHVSTVFKALPNVTLTFQFNFIEALWRIERDPTLEIAQALHMFVAASKTNEAFSQPLLKNDSSLVTLHAGLDIGHVLIAGSQAIGEVITSAVAFAEEAVRQNWPAIIPRELYDLIKDRHETPLTSHMIEVKATVRRNREIVPLSSSDAEYLGEWG
jgi:hypothetical protein